MSFLSIDMGNQDDIPSKRKALQFKALIFDPLGLFSTCTLDLNLFIQECWKNKYHWDAPLPAHLVARWLKLLQEAQDIRDFAIPRRLWSFTGIGKMSLHIFCDASEKAYACWAYLLHQSDVTSLSASFLIFSKVRIAPMKAVNTTAGVDRCAYW